MLKRCLTYTAMIIAAVIGIFVVFRLENDTNLITGSFVQLPAMKFFFVPLAFVLFFVIVIFALNLCKRKD